VGEEEKRSSWVARMMERREIAPEIRAIVLIASLLVGVGVGLLFRFH
jgi:hypothetical protein